MKTILYPIVSLCLCAAFPLAAGANGQAPDPGTSLKDAVNSQAKMSVSESFSDINSLSQEDYVNLQLPPLEVLLENSRKNPSVAYYQLQAEEGQNTLKSARRQWLDYIRIQGNYQYGVNNNLTSFSDIDTGLTSQYYGKSQNFYNAGVSLSLPLSAIFDRRNKIRQQKIVIREAEAQADKWQEEQELKVVDAYTTAVQNLSLLRTMLDAVTVSNAQYAATQADYVNGKVDIQTLSRQKNIQTQNINDYENVRRELNNALLRLEILSKTKIINK